SLPLLLAALPAQRELAATVGVDLAGHEPQETKTAAARSRARRGEPSFELPTHALGECSGVEPRLVTPPARQHVARRRLRLDRHVRAREPVRRQALAEVDGEYPRRERH